jgi:hypothetical protein
MISSKSSVMMNLTAPLVRAYLSNGAGFVVQWLVTKPSIIEFSVLVVCSLCNSQS